MSETWFDHLSLTARASNCLHNHFPSKGELENFGCWKQLYKQIPNCGRLTAKEVWVAVFGSLDVTFPPKRVVAEVSADTANRIADALESIAFSLGDILAVLRQSA